MIFNIHSKNYNLQNDTTDFIKERVQKVLSEHEIICEDDKVNVEIELLKENNFEVKISLWLTRANHHNFSSIGHHQVLTTAILDAISKLETQVTHYIDKNYKNKFKN